MISVRTWAVRHAAFMGGIYDLFERALIRLDPLLARLGYDRLEGPSIAVERGVKGFLFDCRMCGQCALGATGASCPMNCPKELRNGPCGGVRQNGRCEVKPEMTCVWVLAVEGSARMAGGETIRAVQKPLDHRLWGRSAWIGLLRRRAAARNPKPHPAPAARRTPPPLRKAA